MNILGKVLLSSVPHLPLCLTHSVRSAWKVCTLTCEGQLIISLALWMLRCAVQISSSGPKHLFPWSVGCWQFRAESILRNCPWLKWLCLPRLYLFPRGTQHSITGWYGLQGWSPCFSLGHLWGSLQLPSSPWSWLVSVALILLFSFSHSPLHVLFTKAVPWKGVHKFSFLSWFPREANLSIYL